MGTDTIIEGYGGLTGDGGTVLGKPIFGDGGSSI